VSNVSGEAMRRVNSMSHSTAITTSVRGTAVSGSASVGEITGHQTALQSAPESG
jgi:hypothetical protein